MIGASLNQYRITASISAAKTARLSGRATQRLNQDEDSGL